jgi:hypothetical protein
MCHGDQLGFRELPQTLVHFLAVDANVRRRRDADPHLLSFDGRYRYADATIDDDVFADFPCENEHGFSSMNIEASRG